MLRNSQILANAVGFGVILSMTAGYAQPKNSDVALEEIIVTAERREVDMQKVATSVAVRSGTDLLDQGKFNVRQILEDIAGASAIDNSPVVLGGSDVLGNTITIRGITPNNAGGIGPNVVSAPPTTAVYVDGVYEGAGSQYDIERVELLRGPQGTLYGRSATSGVFAVHTVNPSFDGIKGNVLVDEGNYKLQHYSAAVNLPASDKLAFRVSGDYRDQGEGYYNGPGGKRVKTAGRVKMLYKPTETLSILVGGALENNETHSGYINRAINAAASSEINTTTVPVYSGENKQRQLWTEINWDLGAATLTYQGAVRTWTQDDLQHVGAFGSAGYIQQLIQTPSEQFVTHEIRLASDPDSRIKWQTGASYYDNRLESLNRNSLTPANVLVSEIRTSKETEQYGVFGEATYPFTDATRLTAGVRFDRTVVSPELFNTINLNFPFNLAAPANNIVYNIGGADAERKFSNTTFKLRFEHDLTPSNLAYLSVSSGFVPGDVNIIRRTDVTPNVLEAQPVDAETLVAYELGSKNRFWSDTLQLNAAAFFYDYGGFQTSFQTNPAVINSLVYISVPAQNYGAELEALWQMTSHDRIALNYSYVYSKFVDRTNQQHIALFPDSRRGILPQTANGSYEHVFPFGSSELSMRIAARWQASYRADLPTTSDSRVQVYRDNDSRLIGDVDVTWRASGGKYSVGGYVRNFTDKRYYVYTISGTDVTVNQTDPRTVGVVLSARF